MLEYFVICCYMGVSENVVYPFLPNGFADHYPVFKWLFHWDYTLFSDKPICCYTLYVSTCHQSPVTSPFCLEWEIPSQPLQDNLPGPAGRQVVARWCPPNDHVGLEKPLSIWLYVP